MCGECGGVEMYPALKGWDSNVCPDGRNFICFILIHGVNWYGSFVVDGDRDGGGFGGDIGVAAACVFGVGVGGIDCGFFDDA